jgi:YD repeat-containing protein
MLIYCRNIFAISAWVMLLNGIAVSQVPLYENVDPTVAQFPIVRGAGDPDYTGDLNVTIPLMTVPGRGGLDFDVNLIYVHGNGVPASESASWVGLGWNLNMYQITCSPTYDPNVYSSGSLLSGDKDNYYLYYPGGTVPFREFADGWTPLNWSAIKIESFDYTNPSSSEEPDQDYARFVVTDLDGTRYVFGHKLRMKSEKQLTNHCIPNSGILCVHWSGPPYGHPYFYVFKLTAILGANYVDGGGDAYVPGDGGTDKGSWIKLSYTTPDTISPGGYVYSPAVMEVSFLDTITTPTHQAVFNLTSTNDNALIYRGIQNDSVKSLNDVQLKTLDGALIRKISFSKSDNFGWARQNDPPGGVFYNYVYTPDGIGYYEKSRRLRLDSVTIYGQDGQQSLPPYTFAYYGEPGGVQDTSSSSAGSQCLLDPWGLIAPISSGYQSSPDTLMDYCWMLKKITYPTGGSVEFKYETDRYEIPWPELTESQLSTATRVDYRGGVRLKHQFITDPLTSQQDTTTYDYALTNTDFSGGFGFISGRVTGNMDSGVLLGNGIGFNYSNDVHYPDIQITRPDGSKIRKYYTSAFTGPGAGYASPSSSPYIKSFGNVAINDDPYIHDDSIIVPSTFDEAHYLYYNELYYRFWFYDPINHNGYHFRDKYLFSGQYYHERTEPPYNHPPYYREYLALIDEAREYDDHDYSLPNSGYQHLFDNKWKRGHLTYEEIYDATSSTPVQTKKYLYTMKPMKTELLGFVRWVSQQASAIYPGFITSGWAQLTKVETHVRENLSSSNLHLFGQEDFQYNTTNGLVKRQVETNGDNTKRLTSIKYPTDYTTSPANDDYVKAIDSLKTRHIYNAVIQKVIRQQKAGQTDSSVYSAELVKFKKFATGQFLPFETYKFDTTAFLNVTDSQLFNTTSGTFNKHAQYKRQLINEQYDAYGNPTQVKDANGISTTNIFAYNSSLPVARIGNATTAQAMTCIFDDGSAANWTGGAGTWTVANGVYQQTSNTAKPWNVPQRYTNVSIDDAILEADIRFDDTSGDRYVALAKYISASGNIVRFVMRRTASNPGVYVYAKNAGPDSSAVTAKTFNPNQWYHLRGEIQGSVAKLYLDGVLLVTWTNSQVDIANGNIGLCTNASAASFDNVRFYPPAALAFSGSYDSKFLTLNALTDENGISQHFTYDNFGRLKTAHNALGNLVQNIDYYFSSPFSASNPNHVKTILATNAVHHVRNYDFENGGGSQPDYWIGETFGSDCTAAWDNTVSFSGAKSIKAKIPTQGLSNRVRWMVSPWYDEKASPKVTYRMEVWVKTADGYNGNAKFILFFHNAAHAVTETPTITIPTGDREWTKYTLDFTPLSTTDHLYAIYLDFNSKDPITQIATYKGTVWYDRAIFYELNTTKTFADGLGREVQTHQFEGNNRSIQTATLYDPANRVSKVTKPFNSADTLFTLAYNSGAYPTIDSANTWYASTAGNHPVYYNSSTSKEYDTSPYAYSETEYYADPLNRVKRQAAPGTAFRLGTGKEVKFSYLMNGNGEVPGYSANTLLKQRRTDENGNVTSTFTDRFGNTIATIVDSGGLTLKTTFQYDVLGNLAKSRTPNAHATPPNADSTTYAYTTLSRLRQKITPDAGTTEYLYDRNGNLRLVKDAKGAANSYFIYYKYDNFSRILEEGTVTGLTTFRQDSADVPTFPTATSHTAKVKYHYDFAMGTASAPQRNLRGRLEVIDYVTDRYPDKHGYTFYSYDNIGNVEWIEHYIPRSNTGDGNYLVAKIDYQYDALGKVTKTYFRRTFPPGASSDAFYTWYDYDGLGRLERVFTNTIDLKPYTPVAAHYTYWPSGQVKRLALGSTLQGVDYLYNSRDWLSQINHHSLLKGKDPGNDSTNTTGMQTDRFGEIIGYNKMKHIAFDSDYAADTTAQFNGNISWLTLNTNWPATNPDTATGWVFKYDKSNRLTKGNWGHLAQCH